MIDNKVSHPPTETLSQLGSVRGCDDLRSLYKLEKPRRENDRAVGGFRAARREEDREPVIPALRHPLQLVHQQPVMLRWFVTQILRPRRQ